VQSDATQEIVRSLGELKSDTAATLGVLGAKMDGINRRLDVSNGRIAEHEHAIQELQIRASQMGVLLGHVQEEHAARRDSRQRYRIAMFERLLWLLGAVLLAAIVRYAGL